MSSLTVQTIIHATPAEVWAGLEDVATHVDWMADAAEIRFLSDQTSGVGTRFECDTVVGPLKLTDVMEITEWEPEARMGVRHLGIVEGSGVFVLRDIGARRTEFTWTEQLSFPWWMAGPLGAWTSRPVLGAIWRGNLRRLKKRIEAQSSDPLSA